MLISKLVGERKRSASADAVIKSHALLVRAGYIKQVGSGIFSLSMAGQRVCRKIEQIIREEMDKEQGQEVKLPFVMPAALWKESGRFDGVGDELVRFKDRNEQDMVLGMTHEEAAVNFVKSNVNSYNQLPFMIYQFQTKFRDEARSRGGLIRVREFTMKDAYSFHNTQKDLQKYYNRLLKSYERIFKRIGLRRVVAVGSDTGMMGGSMAHEFMLLSDAGEDTLAICPKCGYKANMEIANAHIESRNRSRSMSEQVHTGEATQIDEVAKMLGVQPMDCIKAVCYKLKGKATSVCVFLRGDCEVNEAKLRRILKSEIEPLVASEQYANISFGNIGVDNCGADIVIFDNSLKGENDLVSGANKEGYHIKGVNAEDFCKKFVDVHKVRANDACAKCNHPITLENGIEVGNIFQLGTKYTESMDFSVLGQDGVLFNPIMGCYGIGVGRALASIAEESSDERGLVFPVSVAPWQVYLCGLRLDDQRVNKTAADLYKKLSKSGIETLFDDRVDVSAGTKFNDHELMGIPIRIVVSPKNLDRGVLEISTRYGAIKCEAPLIDAVKTIKNIIRQLQKID